MTEPDARISRWITESGEAIVPPLIARWLEKRAGITADLRANLRRTEPQVHAALMALHIAAMSEDESATGRESGEPTTDRRDSDAWMTTPDVAQAHGVCERTVRRWCDTQQLPATKRGGRWHIRRTDLQAFKMTA